MKTEGLIEDFTMHRRRLQSQIEIVTALKQSCRAYMDASEKLAEIWPPVTAKRHTCRSKRNATEQGGKMAVKGSYLYKKNIDRYSADFILTLGGEEQTVGVALK